MAARTAAESNTPAHAPRDGPQNRAIQGENMSQRDVERALGRLLTDHAFRQDFFEDSAGACLLLGLQLAPSETEALLRVPRPTLVDLAGRLDDRICRFDGRRPGGSVREE